MKKFIKDIICTVFIIFLFILGIIWLIGFLVGFESKTCESGRIITDNWFTGLGYQLSCKR